MPERQTQMGPRQRQKRRTVNPELRAQMVEAYLAGGTMRGLSRSMGWGRYSVRLAVRRAGIVPRCRCPATVRLREPEVVAVMGKFSDTAIAAVVGCARCTVSRIRAELGIPRLPRHRAGDRATIERYSLDANTSYGRSYHEIRKDETWSNWLEENGSTVW